MCLHMCLCQNVSLCVCLRTVQMYLSATATEKNIAICWMRDFIYIYSALSSTDFAIHIGIDTLTTFVRAG